MMTTRTTSPLLALALAATAPGCARARADKPPLRPVRVEAVRRAPAAAGLRYSATIQPYEQVPLAFKAAGYIREIRQVRDADGRTRDLQQGDVVARGMVLAAVNPSDYQERVNQARAQLAEAEAGLVKARADAGRAEALYAAQALTRPDYDGAAAARSSALARAEAAKALLESASLALRDASLSAPVDGVVLSRGVEAGTLVGVGSVAFTIADLRRVKAVFGVPDTVVQRVRIGTELRVRTEAMGTVEARGKVTAVSPSADPQSRVFDVEVTIQNPDRRLKAGMIASVEVEGPDVPDIGAGAPTVSVAAVVRSRRPGAFAVFVADGGGDEAVVRAREIQLGPVSGNRVAVERGLGLGDRVVVSGASLLVDGDRVRVIPGEGE